MGERDFHFPSSSASPDSVYLKEAETHPKCAASSASKPKVTSVACLLNFLASLASDSFIQSFPADFCRYPTLLHRLPLLVVLCMKRQSPCPSQSLLFNINPKAFSAWAVSQLNPAFPALPGGELERVQLPLSLCLSDR